MRISISVISFLIISFSTSLVAQDLLGDQEVKTEEVQTQEPQKGPGVGSIFYGQPGKAALYSLVVPGGGQFYNRRYWKIPIVWGVEGFALHNLIQNINTSRDATSCWRATLGDTDNGDLRRCSADVQALVANSTTQQDAAFDERQSARSGKDVAWILMSTAHLFNIIEAFVDRHLINFDTTEDLSFHNRPNPNITGTSSLVSDITLLRVTVSLNR